MGLSKISLCLLVCILVLGVAVGCAAPAEKTAIELVPTQANLIANIQVNTILNDQDFRAAYDTATKEPEQPQTVEFKDLNLNYFEPQARQSKIASRKSAAKEAQRCFTCGWCTMCGNCWLFCPDSAINQADEKFEINYYYCKGCGICAEECPRGVIFMKEEE